MVNMDGFERAEAFREEALEKGLILQNDAYAPKEASYLFDINLGIFHSKPTPEDTIELLKIAKKYDTELKGLLGCGVKKENLDEKHVYWDRNTGYLNNYISLKDFLIEHGFEKEVEELLKH
jgi:hypothetical protein